jgi:GDPmannose 4,6-dehydratase
MSSTIGHEELGPYDKIAFVTGCTGQDGSYLLELLLKKNYLVYGLVRRSSNIGTTRIDSIMHNQNLILMYGDLTDSSNLTKTISEIKMQNPNFKVFEIYNLGAQSHVKVSFTVPEYTAEVDGLGTLKLLSAIHANGLTSRIKFYQASTSELFGNTTEVPQNENTPFCPRSPYGIAKLYSHWMVKNYREAYDMFACNGILFNHESPRRGVTFVTRKITMGLNSILKGKIDYIELGNLDAKRDWGHAKDYVYGMWLMLQKDEPQDYVLSTNKYYSVRDFVEKAFKYKGFDIVWKGEGANEVGYDKMTKMVLVRVNSKYFRPTEVDFLQGDSSKARKELGWEPKYSIDDIVHEMVDNDCHIEKEDQ